MTRTLASTIVSEITGATVYPVFLAQFEFDSGVLNLWTGYRNLAIGGDIFVGAGELGSVTPTVETESLKAYGLSFSLSGIDTSIIATALSAPYQDRICTLWLGFMDTVGDYIDRVQIFKGRMDTMNIKEEGELATISITAENVLIGLERSNERRYTSEDQKLSFSTDTGFDQVPALQLKEIAWGRS